MNTVTKAVRVLRCALRSLLAAPRAFSRQTPDHILETIARVLCVERHGVMVCGTSAASVAHFSNPHFAAQHTAATP